jgi:hypothetical protein
MVAVDWLRDTEQKLNTVGCSDDEKLRYATYLLSGPAVTDGAVLRHPVGNPKRKV